LEEFLNHNFGENLNLDGLYQTLQNLKFSKELNLKLNLESLFNKDYKAFNYANHTKVGYSVFMVKLEDVLYV